MSVWTQCFLVNIIIFIAWAWADRGLFNDSMEKWFRKGNVREWVFAIYVLFTRASIPAWLIYLVLS